MTADEKSIAFANREEEFLAENSFVDNDVKSPKHAERKRTIFDIPGVV